MSTDVCSKFKLFSFFQVRLQRLQHTVGSNCERHNNFVCLKPRLCACAIGTQTKHMAKGKQMRNWQKRTEMIETNSWQKPSTCDTSSRSKREVARKRCSLGTLTSRSIRFGRATVFHPPVGPRKRSLKICGKFLKCIWRHASRPYTMCLTAAAFTKSVET
jgi:hypothetical protein